MDPSDCGKSKHAKQARKKGKDKLMHSLDKCYDKAKN
jgi:hypothetical protein